MGGSVGVTCVLCKVEDSSAKSVLMVVCTGMVGINGIGLDEGVEEGEMPVGAKVGEKGVDSSAEILDMKR